VCRACATLRVKWKRYPDRAKEHEQDGSVCRLYCPKNHQLFGENVYVYVHAIKGRQRGCRICRREAVERHREENLESIQATSAFRRAVTSKRRVKLAHERIRELISDAESTPALMLVSTLRRLLRWA
jgi:Pyruvate/2-oxoacid:ferredoxin oxidoreductase delta subunit